MGTNKSKDWYQQKSIVPKEYRDNQFSWKVVNDVITKGVRFDALSFFEFIPGKDSLSYYPIKSSKFHPRKFGKDIRENTLGIKSSNDGTIVLGNLSKPIGSDGYQFFNDVPVSAWYLNTGASVGVQHRYGSNFGYPAGRHIDGLGSANSFYVGVQADNSNDEIFTYGGGYYQSEKSTGPITLWERDDKPRMVLSGAGQDFVLGGWGRDIISPGLDKELEGITKVINGLYKDYDKLTGIHWERLLGVKPLEIFNIPGISRNLDKIDNKIIPAAAVQSKAYVGGSMQDIIFGGPKNDVLIGDRISGVEGGISTLPNIVSNINKLIGFDLKTTNLEFAGTDSSKYLSDKYQIPWRDSGSKDTYYHNNWWPFGDLIAGFEGDDVIYGDDTESDPKRIIDLKSMVRGAPGQSGKIQDQLLINNAMGEQQILKTDPLFKDLTWDGRAWDGRGNTQTYKFGNDILLGGDGNDRIYGGFGGDFIIGGRGVDFIDTGEAILADGYKPFYGYDQVWGDLPGKLKGQDAYPDIFNIGPIYLTETDMKAASPNPDTKTLQEMQTEINKATDVFNKNQEFIKKALGTAGDITKAIPIVGPIFSAMFKAGSLFFSKRIAQQLIEDTTIPNATDPSVYIRDFDPLDIINIPLTEILVDNKPSKTTKVSCSASDQSLSDFIIDPFAFSRDPISQPKFESRTAIEIELQNGLGPKMPRVVIERPIWMTNMAKEKGIQITDATIEQFLGYGVTRTKIERDTNPDNLVNKYPSGTDVYSTVYTFAMPSVLEAIAKENGKTVAEFYYATSPI